MLEQLTVAVGDAVREGPLLAVVPEPPTDPAAAATDHAPANGEAIPERTEGGAARDDFREVRAGARERSKGISMASYLEIDDAIDPAEGRRWVATRFGDRAPTWWWSRPGASGG